MTAPLVLPVRPVLGWRLAATWQRMLAVSVVPLVGLWALLLAEAPAAGDAVVALSGLSVGPVAFWCLARVVRPHLDASAERVVRHAIASASTCLGSAVVVGIAVNTRDGDFLGLFAGLASLGLVVTLPWGLVALVVRALRTTVPRPALPTASPGRTA